MKLKGRHSLLINRPKDEVFKFVATDYFENRRKWRPEVVNLKKISDGPMSVGTIGYERSRDAWGRPIDLEVNYVVTEYEPSKRFALKGIANSIDEAGNTTTGPDREPITTEYRVAFTFKSSFGSTKFSVEYQYLLALPIRYILTLPWYASSIKRKSIEGSNRLRDLLEAGHISA